MEGAPAAIASFDFQNVGQHLVIDPDLVERLEGLALGVGDHRNDRLALVAHLFGGQRRLVVLAEVEQAQQGVEIDRHVAAGEDAAHAGAALGLGGGDRADAGMVVGAAQAFQMQHAVEAVIVEERRARGDMAQNVLAPRRLADLVEIVVALVGEQVLAEFHHDPDLTRFAVPSRAWRHREWH
jgi:hypothetical protein